MPHDLTLAGCAPVPIASYLKSLGILRLVAEQADGAARGAWSAEAFVLRSELDADGLRRFLLDEYRPSPIVAPWNGGSGFDPKDNREAHEAIAAGEAARFEALRPVIGASRELVARFALAESPKGDAKAAR